MDKDENVSNDRDVVEIRSEEGPYHDFILLKLEDYPLHEYDKAHTKFAGKRTPDPETSPRRPG